MVRTSIDLMIEQLPDGAKWWVRHLRPAARIEIDRLLKETGVENFTRYWREHRANLEKAEHDFGKKL